MGFNISGIAINRNYKESLEELQSQFRWHLEFQGELNFETASSNWKDDGICDIYFLEKGTLIFIPMDKCIEPYYLPNDNVLTYVLSEISMAFSIHYSEKGVFKRSIMEHNGKIMSDEGVKLEVEVNADDTSEIIWDQIEKVVGCKYGNIDLGATAYRYKFVTSSSQNKEVESKEDLNKANISNVNAPLAYVNKVNSLANKLKYGRIKVFISLFIIITGIITLIISFIFNLPKVIAIGIIIIGAISGLLFLKKLEQDLDQVKKLGLIKKTD